MFLSFIHSFQNNSKFSKVCDKERRVRENSVTRSVNDRSSVQKEEKIPGI